MSKGKISLYIPVMLAFALLPCFNANAQVDSLLRVGDSLYRSYDFGAAIDVFDEAEAVARDTSFMADSALLESISQRILLAENGSNMSRFVRKPNVLGRRKASLEDFHLYYPLVDKSWRGLPNQLDTNISSRFVRSLYAPEWNDRLYFSADGEDGSRDIYMTEIQDTLWSVPLKMEGLSTAMADEIYPMLSPDGKTMYFSSDGLYGLGGYDLYFSTWDDEAKCWSMPQNMGIPFSSPADDFLFMDSDDEKYSVFASTRDCHEDSVWIYVIEYERSPLHTSVQDPGELMTLSRMKRDGRKEENPKVVQKTDDLTSVYMTQMDRVRALKDSIAYVSDYLDDLRTDLAFGNDDSERYELSSKIIEVEKKIPALQKKLDEAQAELQKTEYEFLRKGVFMNPDVSEPSEEDVEVVPEYQFVKRSPGGQLYMNFEVPEVKFDYSFRVLDEAVFAEDQTLPSGVIYQIQLFGGGRKATIKELKGLSPVYEHRSPSGMYIYRVGRFTSYDKALENIHKVRNLGFKGAYVCAFENGAEVSVAKARTIQERLKGGFELYEIHLMPESGELDSAAVETISVTAVGKDIIRTEAEDGTQIFTVGPFDSKADAESLVDRLNDIMPGKVVCEPIN
jgi:hypothetical protein